MCDGAFMEYSTNGTDWYRLEIADSTKEYANWYNDTGYRIWSIQDFTNWHEATISLPRGGENLQLRFVMFF